MEVRTHKRGEVRSRAVYSPCGAHRYLLSRRWGDGPRLLWIMLNPSTATEEANDPTIERCERRARAGGFGGYDIANLFSFRATRPVDLRRARAPVGPENDRLLMESARGASLILCAWGVHGEHEGRGVEVEAVLRGSGLTLHTLGLTKAGHPRHPLYVSYEIGPSPWPSIEQ